jgi:hypothetical protein
MPAPTQAEFGQTELSSRISHLSHAFRRNFTESIVKPESVNQTSRSQTTPVISGNRHAGCVGIANPIVCFSSIYPNRSWRDRCWH